MNRPILSRGVLAALLASSCALAFAATPASKEERHARMAQLQAQIGASKGASSQAAQLETSNATRELADISASLGGDLPCAKRDMALAANKTGSAKAAPDAPDGCLPIATALDNTTPVPIPTGPGVVTSTITVAGAGAYLWDVDVTTFLQHTFSADLDVTITSPAGTVVTLTTDNGGSNDDVFNGTVWDDDANPLGQVPYTTNDGLVTDQAYVNLTLASPLVPEEALAAFVGEDPNGEWTLTISDDLAGDGGSLNTWSLALTSFAAAPIESAVLSFEQATPLAIPTGPETVASSIAVDGLVAPVCKAVVRTNMAHSFSADLDVTLTSPSGTVVTLTTDNGAGNDNVFAGTVWTDIANPGGQVPYVNNDGVVTDQLYVNLTLASPLVPEESMGAFIGEDGNGTWTLTISDDGAGDGGELTDWGLDFVTCTCASADVGIAVTDTPDPVAAGGTLTYDFTVTNAGASAAADIDFDTATPVGTVFASLSAPPGSACTTPAVGAAGAVHCDAPTLAVGPPQLFSVAVTVDIGTANGTFLALTGTVASSTADPVPGNNTTDASTQVVANADLSITKTDGVTSAAPGGSVLYTIVAANAGPATATGAAVTDTFPAALTCTWTSVPAGGATGTAGAGAGNIAENLTLPAGASVTYSADCDIDGAATGSLSNTVTIGVPADVSDPDLANNTATDIDALGAQADLSVTKSATPLVVVPGESVTYTIVAANAGPSGVTDAQLADTFPAGFTCTWTATFAGGASGTAAGAGNIAQVLVLPTGASATFTAACDVPADATSGTVSNTATLTSAGSTDPVPGNNTDGADITVSGAAVITASKSVAGTDFRPGSNATYSIVLSNTGSTAQADNPGAEFVDALPAGVTYVSSSASSGATSFAAGTVSWNGAIAIGGSVTIGIIVSIDADATGVIANQGTANFDSDNNGSNDATVVTDDPSTGGAGDATGFEVEEVTGVPVVPPQFVPATDRLVLVALVLLLLGLGWRRRLG